MTDIKEIRNSLIHLEKAKVLLHTELQKKEKEELLKLHIPGLPGAECELKDNILKFTFFDKLPIVRKNDEFDDEMMRLWAGQLVYAYYSNNIKINFKKA